MRRSRALGDGPRERLYSCGSSALSDAELLALIFRTGGRGSDALGTARRLLDRARGLVSLASLTPTEITREPGLGIAKAAALTAAFELGRRLAARRLVPGVAVSGPADVYAHFHPRLRDDRQECFATLLLDSRRRLIREFWVTRGTLTASLVHPREVFRGALREAAAAIVLVHNHPSGDPEPSPEDREVTERLVRVGALIGIPVVDHVVIAETGYRSLRSEGLFPEGDESGPAWPVGHP